MHRFINLAWLLLASVCLAQDSSLVQPMNVDNFQAEVVKSQLTLVMFYAPWCGHCKALLPEYDKASVLLKDDTRIALGKVDCTVDRDLCAKYGVRGFPTLKIFRSAGGEPSEYDAPRKAESIKNFMEKQAAPAIADVSREIEVNDLVNNDDVVVCAFVASKDGAQYKAFAEVGTKLRSDYRFAVVIDGDGKLAKKYGSGVPGIVIFRKFDENPMKGVVFAGNQAFSGDDVRAFIRMYSFPLVGEIGPSNYHKYIERDLPMLWFFIPSDDNGVTKDAILKVAETYVDKFSFVTLDGIVWAEHAKSFGLVANQLPAVVLEDRVAGLNYIYSEGTAVEGDELAAWLERAVDGSLTATQRSEDPPESNDEPVTIVVGKTYDEIVLDDAKDVLVEFYAPWCGHCKSLEPKYDAVGAAFADEPGVVIAKIDATANDTPNRIQGFPTLLWFPAGGKASPVTYEGVRDEEAMIEWVRERATTLKGGKKKRTKHDEL